MLDKPAGKTTLLWIPGHHMIASNEKVVACAEQTAAIIDSVPLIAFFVELRIITGQLKITPLEAFRMEAGAPSIAAHAQLQAVVAYNKAHRLPTNQSRTTLLEEPCRHRIKRPSWRSADKALMNRLKKLPFPRETPPSGRYLTLKNSNIWKNDSYGKRATEARLIGLGDRNGDDQANHRINSTTMRASGTNPNNKDNFANRRITWSVVSQDLTQL